MTNFVSQFVAPAEGASTLEGRYYTSAQIFQTEIEQVFYQRWLCVGRAEQIPQPGDYFTQTIGAESLIITRGQDSQVRAFYNVCRHRGTRICTASTGHFVGSIQCPYHAWTYGLDGRLIGAPHMNEVEGFAKAKYPLYQAAIGSWEGFLFVNLSPQPEPFEQAFAALIGRFNQWGIAALRSARRIEYDVQANWKLLVENYSECYHCPLIHPALSALSPYRSGRNDLIEGPFLGGYMDLERHVESLSLNGHTCTLPLPGVAGEDLNRVYYYSLFPNMLLSLHPDYVMFHLLWPEGAGRTRITCDWLFEPQAMTQPNFDPSGAVEFWDMTNRQDWHVCELSQLGLTSRMYTPGPYSAGESLSAAFDQEVLRALGIH
jgi:Rieske 2Fe-2S family protein